MAKQYKTPGVYIVEQDAFSNSVVEVPTGIPVFIGYTEKASRGDESLANKPTRIVSQLEYITMFGNAAVTKIVLSADKAPVPSIADEPQYLMFEAMRLFFQNGGGTCWIVSVGQYGQTISKDNLLAPLQERGILEKTPEPDVVCIPEAVFLSIAEWAALSNAAIDHCQKMRNRIALIDVFDGWKARDHDAKQDVISGSEAGLRANITSDGLSYAAAYYPWLNTIITGEKDVGLDRFEPGDQSKLATLLAEEGDATDDSTLTKLAEYFRRAIKKSNPDKTVAKQAKDTGKKRPDSMTLEQIHDAAMNSSPGYRTLMSEVLQLLNRLPPSAAIAGVYARTDAEIGVFKAPANTVLSAVVSPTIAVSHEEREDLNVPLDGKAINAICAFAGRGVLVWGARTLDGNSQDWRYINVRRTLIMLEQSIRNAIEAYTFAPNDVSTWATIKQVLSDFLSNQWKAGALVGATPEEAFSVDVGLGSTMTDDDILNGRMNVVVQVAPIHPAEFIVLTLQQTMQTS